MRSENCLACDKYMGCPDIRKGSQHICNKFKPLKIESATDIFKYHEGMLLTGQSEVMLTDSEDEIETELNLIEMIDELMNPANRVPFDLKIDDRELKEYPNFYSMCIDPKGLNTKPFPRQLAAATHLLSEYCPNCSHEKFLSIYTTPLRAPLESFPDYVTFLEFGVCPKCGETKQTLFKSGKLKLYDELAACIGQRGGKSATIAMICAYLIHRILKLQDPIAVYGLQPGSILTGTFVGLTLKNAINLLWTPIHNIISRSPWFCVKFDSLITLADGSTKEIQHIEIGDKVKTLEGESTITNVFNNGVQECKEVTLNNGHTLIGTDGHKVRCLTQDGQNLVWKKVSDLTEDDFVVVE